MMMIAQIRIEPLGFAVTLDQPNQPDFGERQQCSVHRIERNPGIAPPDLFVHDLGVRMILRFHQLTKNHRPLRRDFQLVLSALRLKFRHA